MGIVLDDDEFHSLASDGVEITVDLDARVVQAGGKSWEFKLDDLELGLIDNGGIASAFSRFGKGLFEKLTAFKAERKDDHGRIPSLTTEAEPTKELQW